MSAGENVLSIAQVNLMPACISYLMADRVWSVDSLYPCNGARHLVAPPANPHPVLPPLLRARSEQKAGWGQREID